MQIKELIVKNFKSFSYSTIPFKDGFQVVVGPNGSGKSNIVDALLFVFGETSLKKLRVDKLSDLVNHNSKTKSARVRVVFTHENKEYDVVREIDESGKSILMLNNKRKALNEVTCFLNELGISSSGYNTVQQGDVTRIINMSSEERRRIIEDLSGISLFDERKKEAEDNLKKVDKRLEKVSIALNERKPYVEQLEQEKEDALKYKNLDTEEKKYSVNLLLKQKENYQQQETIEQEKINSFNEEIKEKEQEKKELINQEEKLEQQQDKINSLLISHSEKVHESVGKKHVEALSQKEIVQNNLLFKKNSLDSLKQEKITQEKEVNNITETKNILEKEILFVEKELTAKETERNKVKKQIEQNKNNYDKSKQQQMELYEKINKINIDIEDLQDQYFENKNKITTYNIEQENLQKESKKKEERIISLKEFKQNIISEKTTLEKEIEQVTIKLEQTTKELTLKIKEQEELVVDLAQINANLDNLNKQKQKYLGLKETKEKIKKTFEKENNFIGFLEDVVALKEEQKAYFSRYLVFKENRELDKLTKEIDQYGIFSIIVLENLEITKEKLKQKIDEKTISSKNIQKIKGYFYDGFCYKKINVKETENVLKEIEKDQKERDAKKKMLDAIKEKIKEIDDVIRELKNNHSTKSVLYNTKISLLNDVEEKLVVEEKAILNKGITLNIGQIKETISQLEEKINQQKLQKKEIETKLSGVSITEQENLRDQYDVLTNDINENKQQTIQKKSRMQMFLEKKESLLKYLKENENKQEIVQKEVENLQKQEQTIDKTIKILEEEINKANQEKQKLFAEKSQINQDLSEVSKKLSSIDFLISDVKANISETNININTLKNKLEQIDQNITLFDDISDIEQMDLPLEEISSKLRSIRREKNALGNINFNAIDSYNKLAKEYKEIIEKYEVLLKEKEQVKNMLYEITLKKQKIFMDCYRQINNEFEIVISKMSKTITGCLELFGEEPLDSKLLINLTKNNKTKNIDIMSGGEKSITALAFIFAINAYKKYSFYVLDEVDAALDDLNTKNLLSYIKDISQTATIVAISHNNLLVNGADQVIGVTLKDHSSVIGLNI
jgi:chromosome segregation protein